MIDAVLSYHLNPQTCGVAKWNHALAKRLGVRCLSIDCDTMHHPLVSVKPSECPVWTLPPYPVCDLFLHGWAGGPLDLKWLAAQEPVRVFAADRTIADAVRPHVREVITAFCPPTVEGNPTRGKYRVLSFGMASKIHDVLPHFQNLKEELDRDHPDYTLSLSTAVHEGSPWDESLTQSIDAMRSIFGDKLRVLGYLADDALAKELQDCDAVAAYFVPALRANNTSAWAALAAGKFLYTNLDAQSPDLDPAKYSWDALLDVLA